MARVVETEEPIVTEREVVHHVHDDAPARNPIGTILAVLAVIIILALLFWWRPWSSGGGSSTTNVNVPTPSVNVTK